MFDADPFQGLQLPGAFIVVSLELTTVPLMDAVGRLALAKTSIIGHELRVTVVATSNDHEISVSIYHEILEAMTVASLEPPATVIDFNEGDFERAAYQAHERLGPVSRANLRTMLQSYGFEEE